MTTRDTLIHGTHDLTITLPETFVRARELMGDFWHAEYRYQLRRVTSNDGGSFLFAYSWTTNTKGENGRWVYMGSVDLRTGALALTGRSAFPASATRVKICDRVLRRVFAGDADAITAAGWMLDVSEEAAVACPF